MTLRAYIIGMIIATSLCLSSFILVLFYINPTQTNTLGFVCFYLSLLFTLAGLFTLLGFYIRKWFTHNEIIFAHVGISFRQALLFSLCITGCLILQSMRMFSFWTGGLLIASICLLEFFFLAR